MLLPNINSMYRWINNFFQGGPNGSQDFLQLVRQRDKTVLGWIDETGTPRGSLANAPSSLAGPGFINLPVTVQSQIYPFAGVNGFPALTQASGIGGFIFFLPTEITTTTFAFGFAMPESSDSSSEYDFGIYGPFTGVESVLPLICHTGPQTFSYDGGGPQLAEIPWASGSVSIPAGYYFLMLTTASSPEFGLEVPGLETSNQGSLVSTYLRFAASVITGSSNSTLPSTINITSGFTSGGTSLVQMQFAMF